MSAQDSLTADEISALCAELSNGKLRPLLRKEAADLIESQAARIAELEQQLADAARNYFALNTTHETLAARDEVDPWDDAAFVRSLSTDKGTATP